MTGYYNHRQYWSDHLKKQGALYVSSGNSKKVNNVQQTVFSSALLQAIGDTDPGNILDFGCGVGRFAETALTKASSYTGVDIAAGAFEHAPEVPGAEFVGLPEDTIPFTDGHFDSAMSLTVLQHIVDPKQFSNWAGELDRVVKSGGYFYIIDDAKPRGEGEALPAMFHMSIRGPQVISEALGAVVDEDFGIITAERKNSHYLFRARKL